MSKLSQEQIYNALRDLFPGEYMPLRRMKPAVPHPGNEPRKAPHPSLKTIHTKTVVTPDMTVQQIAEQLGSIPTKSFSISISYEPDGEEEYEVSDWYWDGECETEYTDIRTRPTYSDRVKSITFSASYNDPNWDNVVAELKAERRAWVDRIRNYHEVKKQRKEAKAYNNELITAARKSNPDRWASVGRYLKGKADPEFLQKQLDRLNVQADRIRSLLAEQE